MPPRSSAELGFTLIEAIIVIAIMAILAGAAVPFAIKALNQAREGRTRENLKAAYEAMFGARDRRVSNMRADFGFDPVANQPTLGKMITSTAAPGPNPPTTYALNGALFSWGWNGPYWTGPTKLVAGTQVPVDAWGAPIQLRLIPGGVGFQVISWGANGTLDTLPTQVQPQKDDLVYPAQPAPLNSAYSSSPSVTILNKRLTPILGTLTLLYRNGRNVPGTWTTPISLAVGQPLVYSPTACPSGPMQVVINITTGTPITYQEVVDLLPGESHAFSYTIN